eukprot:7216693-Pyramimonas_sp.AAC.2
MALQRSRCYTIKCTVARRERKAPAQHAAPMFPAAPCACAPARRSSCLRRQRKRNHEQSAQLRAAVYTTCTSVTTPLPHAPRPRRPCARPAVPATPPRGRALVSRGHRRVRLTTVAPCFGTLG